MLDDKLNKILKVFILLSQRDKVTQLLTSAEDADKLVTMVGDIRDMVMEYQGSSSLSACSYSI